MPQASWRSHKLERMLWVANYSAEWKKRKSFICAMCTQIHDRNYHLRSSFILEEAISVYNSSFYVGIFFYRKSKTFSTNTPTVRHISPYIIHYMGWSWQQQELNLFQLSRLKPILIQMFFLVWNNCVWWKNRESVCFSFSILWVFRWITKCQKMCFL